MFKVLFLVGFLFSVYQAPVFAVNAEVGARLAEKGEYQRAFTIWQPLAKQGDAMSQFYLGVYYEEGLGGGNNNFPQAMYWYNKAIAQGVDKAYYNLGNMFYSGRGVTVNYKEAARRFRQAAELNYAPAQFNLGHILEQGLIAKKAPIPAFEWYQKAAENGLPEAQLKVAKAYEKGLGIKADRQSAIYWYQKAIKDESDPAALIDLAQLYLANTKDPRQQQEGINLLREAADQGQPLAQYELGLFYGKGQVLKKDYEQAVFWYKRAAKQQVVDAQYLLCLSYSLGKGVPVDIINAHVWCEAALKNGGDEEVKEALLTLRESMTPVQLKTAAELAPIINPH